ncbi:hypothetical protein DsansV1_C19g0162301 [Dioscorea sansibarensis]
MGDTFDPDLIHSIFKLIWKRTSARDEDTPLIDVEADGGTSKKSRPTTANAGALKISCELLRLFVTGCAACCYNCRSRGHSED